MHPVLVKGDLCHIDIEQNATLDASGLQRTLIQG